VAKLLNDKYDRSYFHQEYLSGRDKIERKLYQFFIDKGGKPEIKRPIYCFMGMHPSELIYSRRADYAFKFFRVSDIPSELISFTYPGSIASMRIAHEEEAQEFRSSYHGKLYRKEEINDVIAEHGMPGIDFVPSGSRRYDVLVEAQIWSTSVFDEIEEVTDVEASWLPWITDSPEDRSGIAKD